MTLPQKIRSACGVKSFDVVRTEEELVTHYMILIEYGISPITVLSIIGGIYRAAQREITTPYANDTCG